MSNIFNLPTRTYSKPASVFCQEILNIGGQERDDHIFNEIKNGNISEWLNNVVAINISDGKNTLQYYVMPDVLVIGTYTDFIRVPLMGKTYKMVGDLIGATLPTKMMCDQIWRAADMKLNPQPIPPDASMENTQRFIDHNNLIEQQRANKNFHLITGHKKDTVICKHLLQDSSRVAIYGWFNQNGNAIQGLNSTSHDKFYRDYSHSGRMVARNCVLNGSSFDIYTILNDPNLWHLISDEGYYNALVIYGS